MEELRGLRDKEIARIQRVDRQIDALWKQEEEECQKVFSFLTEKSVYFGIRRYAARYNDNFILTGWVPADREQTFDERSANWNRSNTPLKCGRGDEPLSSRCTKE